MTVHYSNITQSNNNNNHNSTIYTSIHDQYTTQYNNITQSPSSCQDYMVDSTELYNTKQYKLLKQRLRHDGYLLIRNIISTNNVLQARYTVLDTLQQNFNTCYKTISSQQQHYNNNNSLLLTGYTPLTNNQHIKSVSHHYNIQQLFTNLFDDKVDNNATQLDNTWIRCISPNEYTEPHSDCYRFLSYDNNDNTQQQSLYTVWAPLGDYNMHIDSTLCVLPTTHYYVEEQQEYNTTDELPYDLSTYCFNNNIQWLSSNFNAGDIVIFDIGLVHCSSINHRQQQYRISLDTRWSITQSNCCNHQCQQYSKHITQPTILPI